MANECINTLKFIAKQKDIDKLFLYIDSIHNKDVEQMFELVEGCGEYVLYFHVEDTGEVNFYSKWTPPISSITKLSNMFPNIEIELLYEELGDGLYGYSLFKNGEHIIDADIRDEIKLISYNEDTDQHTYKGKVIESKNYYDLLDELLEREIQKKRKLINNN